MIVLKGKSQRVEVLAFAPSSDELVSAGTGGWLDLWRFTAGSKPERLFEHSGDYVTSLAYIDEGRAVLAACWNAGLRVHPLSPKSKHRAAAYPGPDTPTGFTIAGDGTRVISFHVDHLSRRNGDECFQCWVADGTGAYRPEWTATVPTGWCRAIAVLPGGARFAACELTGRTAAEHNARLVVRGVGDGNILSAYSCPYLFVHQLAVSPDEQRLLAVSRMGLLIWPVADLSAPPRKVLNDNRKHFTDVAFHPSGRYLAAASNDKTVKLYDTTSWQVAKTFTWDIGRIRSVAFSPDGLLAAAGSDRGRIVVWDVDV